MKRSRWGWKRTAVALGIGALGVGTLASVGTAVSPSGTLAAAKQYPPGKVTLCHHTHSKRHPFVTINVSQRALPAHLRHGDTIGPCPSTAPAKQKAAKAHSRGKSDERAKKSHAVTAHAAKAARVERSTGSPGRSGTAPGRAGTAPGQGGGTTVRTPPARVTTPPGHDGSAPAEVAGPPSSSGPPGHQASPPHGGTPPGHGGTPPGQSGSPAGNSTPPGHGGTPPGQGKDK
jgi:hypothetical protein